MGVTNEQVEAAVLGLLDEWNSNLNPRTQRRYKQPWSSGVWFTMMRAGLGSVITSDKCIIAIDDLTWLWNRAPLGPIDDDSNERFVRVKDLIDGGS
jgi:hypothetical protein